MIKLTKRFLRAIWKIGIVEDDVETEDFGTKCNRGTYPACNRHHSVQYYCFFKISPGSKILGIIIKIIITINNVTYRIMCKFE